MNLNPWPYSYVIKRAKEAAIDARQQGLRPALAKDVVKNWRFSKRFNVPFLGEYIPEGWEEIEDNVVVDITGSSRPGNPVLLTQPEFFALAEGYAEKDETYGFGVIEQGQTQVLIALYRKES